MKSRLATLLALAAATGAMAEAPRREFKLTGRDSKPQDEQSQAILAAQAKREKRAAKRLGKQI
jgi:hypothetical protein